MPAPLVYAAGIAARQAAVWGFRRILLPGLRWAGRQLWAGLKWVGNKLSTLGSSLRRVMGRRMSGLSNLANLLNLGSTVDKSLPTHFEEVDVTVYGSPKATKKDLWRLAIAAAFGKVQRRGLGLIDAFGFGKVILPPPGFIQMEYPLEGNAVRVTLRMETPYLNLFAGRIRKSRDFELYSGPEEDVKGGKWGWDSVLPGVGANFAGTYPQTGFENRTLLTPSPTYRDSTNQIRASASPHPIGDKVSRSSTPVTDSQLNRNLDPKNWNNAPSYLLFQALSAPCENRLSPPPTGTPTPPPAPPSDLITGTPLSPFNPFNPDGTPTTDAPTLPDYSPPEPQENPPGATSSQPVLEVPNGTPINGQGLPPAASDPNTLPPSFNPNNFPSGNLFDYGNLNFSGGVAKPNGPVSPVLPPLSNNPGGSF